MNINKLKTHISYLELQEIMAKFSKNPEKFLNLSFSDQFKINDYFTTINCILIFNELKEKFNIKNIRWMSCKSLEEIINLIEKEKNEY